MSQAQRKTAIAFDEGFKRHETGQGHPESPQRIDAIAEALSSPRLTELKRLEPRSATAEDILLVHWDRHYEEILATRGKSGIRLDPDTPTSSDSSDVAHGAAGSVLSAVDAVASPEVDNAFAFSRPPGHHAKPDKAMGFCLFNNVAIAARYASQKYGWNRILIVDFDVHHGNGTQKAFYTSPEVLFVSAHQFPHYPGTGAPNEIGKDDGLGFTVNIPTSAGMGDGEYLRLFRELVLPVGEEFAPDLVLVSAGFDAHRDDPLGGVDLTEAGYGAMISELLALAEANCGGRLVCALEGGYHLAALTRSVETVLSVMSSSAEPAEVISSGGDELLSELGKIHRVYWPTLKL